MSETIGINGVKHVSKISFDDLLQRTMSTHGDKYYYIRIVSIVKKTKPVRFVEYYCKACKEVKLQRLHDHLKGNGCKKCGRRVGYKHQRKISDLDFDQLVVMFKVKYGDRHDYSHIYRKKGIRRVVYRCLVCNSINDQSIYDHLNGTRCKTCNLNDLHELTRTKEETAFPILRKLHKNRYTYHRIIPKKEHGKYTMISYTCNMCGLKNTQMLNNHTRGCGCRECGMKRIL